MPIQRGDYVRPNNPSPGRRGVHVQGPSLLARTTPRTRPNWQRNSVFSYRRNGFIAGE